MMKVAFGSIGDSFSIDSVRAYLAEFIATLLFVFAGVGSALAFNKLTTDAPQDPAGLGAVARLVSQRPVVIFSKSSCCMSHTIKTLFSNFGVNPLVYELDEDPKGRDLERTLVRLGRNPVVPTVFIGGELVGGAIEVMRLHLSGSLVPLLKTVGAIWV